MTPPTIGTVAMGDTEAATCEKCGGDKGRYDFDPLGCSCASQPKETWTGAKCPKCNGYGARKDDDGEERRCPDCAGTGDEYGFKFPDDFFDDKFDKPEPNDTALQAAAREAGWALSTLVDEISFEKRQETVNIINRLSAALSTRPAQEPVGWRCSAIGKMRRAIHPWMVDPKPVYLAAPQPVLSQPEVKAETMADVSCPCTLIEQDEDCPVGYPSMICGICEGKGHTTQEQVTALACEMIKIASDVGEPEDPFAAWESISLIQSQNNQFRKAADEALQAMSRCEHDGGFDREIGPIGCNIGDKCVCIGIYPIIAQSALCPLSDIPAQAGEVVAELCIACDVPFEDGDMVYWSSDDTGHLHADCCGPERESYVNADGEPLKDGEPIPAPFAWRADR